MLSILGRASVSKVTAPIGKALLATGLTPDIMTVIGTVATIAAALTLFPMGYLFAGTLVIWLFVMFDMLDGAMARARGGGTRFGAVLDATCDRIADGAIFAGLAWWCMVEKPHQLLFVATLICLVTSQVISYAKARAEASGLYGDGGLIERPDRLIIVLVGSGFTGLGIWWAVHVAMWLLAAGSIITVFQRMHSIASSPGARDLIPIAAKADTEDKRDGEANGDGDDAAGSDPR
ncbi:CDP-alcohol phosphatidyltransferase family protein [Gordonia amarae]|uniref:Phosphatidylinositol phosphate synthase n=2 Tax=Gordonia amarae TaxID=36821 RepID=G7GL62_9ACTN|nr:CDP-alcohol phosphatidyltransferase family protein [Gordonia amarae]MCS3878863.1 CDP-diacylglycerol--glycerol-3-phosphate 3-phosphatidyltransferase [Gordonia amarae]QHN17422.1 CDP-alcohol phosphatidyltransferase family protein [Gordonia amarae]QHN21948.1 CDP-alcohol phosphatidyltransferase family protein [Gordonia amarae]QHN30828.1 CDP-alcohol phosphatidyltransferase family protein [Gordonia amarae]QHN39574.1 CDP-alcohol phosphatidyltransferase family protein [Gordonia amarae]